MVNEKRSQLDAPACAERFELFIGGYEYANAYEVGEKSKEKKWIL